MSGLSLKKEVRFALTGTVRYIEVMPTKSKKLSVNLPDKLSDLLELAVKDAQAVKAKGYTLNMGYWKRYERGKSCSVCMAGAVLVQRGKVPKSKDLAGRDKVNAYVDPIVMKKLDLINDMRTGETTNLDTGAAPAMMLIRTEYYRGVNGLDRAKWSTYRKAVKMLREAGL